MISANEIFLRTNLIKLLQGFSLYYSCSNTYFLSYYSYLYSDSISNSVFSIFGSTVIYFICDTYYIYYIIYELSYSRRSTKIVWIFSNIFLFTFSHYFVGILNMYFEATNTIPAFYAKPIIFWKRYLFTISVCMYCIGLEGCIHNFCFILIISILY